MDNLKMKKELLETLRNDMRQMIREEKHSSLKENPIKEMMEEHEGKDSVKATIIGDSPEDIIEGAKMIPKVMTKAEEFMKSRLGDDLESIDEDPKKKKKK